MIAPVEAVRAARDFLAAVEAYEEAAARADHAFVRWLRKAERGERTNAAGATRSANLANYASADRAAAETSLWLLLPDVGSEEELLAVARRIAESAGRG